MSGSLYSLRVSFFKDDWEAAAAYKMILLKVNEVLVRVGWILSGGIVLSHMIFEL
jgi:hypothetical protein